MATSYVRFEEVGDQLKRTTRTWVVTSTSGSFLGHVQWFGRWRGYCFFPEPETVFNHGCMNDIATFCVRMTTAHLARNRARREEAKRASCS